MQQWRAALLKLSPRGRYEKTLGPLKGDVWYCRRFYGFNKNSCETARAARHGCDAVPRHLDAYYFLCFPGVIAVVIFVILACLAVMARFFYRRKETFQTQQSKGAKSEDGPETAFNADPSAQSVIGESQKEYFIWKSLSFFLIKLQD